MCDAQQILCVCLLTCFLNCCISEESKQIKVKPGNDVLLQCGGSTDAAVVMLKWIRPDLEPEGFVYFVIEKQRYKNVQHESFRGRVEVRDPEMKDGDVSIILKNITINDAGTYECYVGYGDKHEVINIINLTVEPGHTEEGGDKEGGDKEGGDKEGHVGLAVAVSVLVMQVAVIAFVILRTVITQCLQTS